MQQNSDPLRPERRATLRLGQRELSRLTLLIVVAVLVPLGWGLFRVYKNFKSQRDVVIAHDNMVRLIKAFRGYAADWDGAMPKPDRWADSIGGYIQVPPDTPGGKLGALEGPGDGIEQIRYVYNDLAAGYNFEKPDKRYGDPSEIVLLFERPGAPLNAHVSIPPQVPGERASESAFYKQLAFPHYADAGDNATTVVLYLSGTIRRLRRADFAGPDRTTN
jgi:hypothetical protein